VVWVGAGMKPITSVSEAVALIDAFAGEPSAFPLCLSESIHDPVGVNIAIITDRIVARGWWPAGVERYEGFRIYRYKQRDLNP
jgi:hypothetical protein